MAKRINYTFTVSLTMRFTLQVSKFGTYIDIFQQDKGNSVSAIKVLKFSTQP